MKVKLLFFLFTLLSTSPFSYSQSFFYLETKLPALGSSAITISVLLRMDTDSTGTARIKYPDPKSGKKCLIEVYLKSEKTSGAVVNKNDKWLAPKWQGVLVAGTADNSSFIPRFIVTKQAATNGSRYAPTALAYKMKDGSWQQGTMLVNKAKTIQELAGEGEILLSFYKPGEEFMHDERNEPVYVWNLLGPIQWHPLHKTCPPKRKDVFDYCG